MLQTNDIRSLGVTASSANQTGELRSSPEFEAMQTQINNLNSLHTEQPVNWTEIIDLGCHILSKQGKDINVASWLCLALLQQNGLHGLSDGMHVFSTMVQNFWQDMQPPIKRIRARRNQAQWLLD